MMGTATCGEILADFTISNETEHKPSEASIRLGETARSLGDIPPGGKRMFRGLLTGQGAPTVSYTIKGKRVTIETCYQTGGLPLKGQLRIRPQEVTRRCG
jgi:hypothetical protein